MPYSPTATLILRCWKHQNVFVVMSLLADITLHVPYKLVKKTTNPSKWVCYVLDIYVTTVEDKHGFMGRLTHIRHQTMPHSIPPARPLTDNHELMTMAFDKMEAETKHTQTKMYQSSAYIWWGSIKAAHTCTEDKWKCNSSLPKLLRWYLLKESCTFSYQVYFLTSLPFMTMRLLTWTFVKL